jgi:hypothetical protein
MSKDNISIKENVLFWTLCLTDTRVFYIQSSKPVLSSPFSFFLFAVRYTSKRYLRLIKLFGD